MNSGKAETMGRRRLDVGEVGAVNAQKSRGGWRARCWYRGQDGRKHQVDIERRTKTAALKDARAIAEERANLGNADLNANSPLSALLESWWATVEQRADAGKLSEGTLAAYRTPYERVKSERGHLLIRECSAPRLGAWVEEAAEGKPSVHRSLRRVLSQAFAFGESQGIVTFNPGKAIPTMETAAKETTALTPKEVARLRNVIHDWEEKNVGKSKPGTGGRPLQPYLADVVDVMLGTGFRIGEVLGLRWEDVNFAANPVEVTVAGSVKQRKATPDSPSLVWEPRPKTKSGRRTVSVPTFTADALHRLNIEKAPDAVFVFATANGTPRSPANVRTRLRRVCGSTFEGLTPHTLRRTVLTIVAEQTDVLTASRVAGHANTKITEDKYLKFGPKAPDASWALESLGAGETS